MPNRSPRRPLVTGVNLTDPAPGTIVLPDGVAVPPSAPPADKARFVDNELALLVAQATEKTLCRMVLILAGAEPTQEDLVKRGTIVPGTDDSGDFEDFCWDGSPIVRRRIRFNATTLLFALEPQV